MDLGLFFVSMGAVHKAMAEQLEECEEQACSSDRGIMARRRRQPARSLVAVTRMVVRAIARPERART